MDEDSEEADAAEDAALEAELAALEAEEAELLRLEALEKASEPVADSEEFVEDSPPVDAEPPPSDADAPSEADSVAAAEAALAAEEAALAVALAAEAAEEAALAAEGAERLHEESKDEEDSEAAMAAEEAALAAEEAALLAEEAELAQDEAALRAEEEELDDMIAEVEAEEATLEAEVTAPLPADTSQAGVQIGGSQATSVHKGAISQPALPPPLETVGPAVPISEAPLSTVPVPPPAAGAAAAAAWYCARHQGDHLCSQGAHAAQQQNQLPPVASRPAGAPITVPAAARPVAPAPRVASLGELSQPLSEVLGGSEVHGADEGPWLPVEVALSRAAEARRQVSEAERGPRGSAAESADEGAVSTARIYGLDALPVAEATAAAAEATTAAAATAAAVDQRVGWRGGEANGAGHHEGSQAADATRAGGQSTTAHAMPSSHAAVPASATKAGKRRGGHPADPHPLNHSPRPASREGVSGGQQVRELAREVVPRTKGRSSASHGDGTRGGARGGARGGGSAVHRREASPGRGGRRVSGRAAAAEGPRQTGSAAEGAAADAMALAASFAAGGTSSPEALLVEIQRLREAFDFFDVQQAGEPRARAEHIPST